MKAMMHASIWVSMLILENLRVAEAAGVKWRSVADSGFQLLRPFDRNTKG